jgi:hypothetical protein
MTERDPSMTTPLTPGTGDPSTPVPAPIAPTQPVAPAAPAAATTSAGAARKRSAGWLNLLLGAAAVIAVGGVAFAIGRSTAPTDAIGFVPGGGGPVMIQPGGSFDPNGGPILRQGGPGGLGAGLSMDGTVTAVDADSVTIKLDSGEEVTFDLDAETTYHEATPTDAAAIAVGDEVAVQASGGRIQIDSSTGGGTTSNGAPTLSAEDVTVRR